MKTIGLLIEETFYSFANLLIAGAEEGLRGSGVRLVCVVGGALNDSRRWAVRRNVLYDLVTETEFDGLLISASLGHFVGTGPFAQFCHRWPGLPVVTISMPVPGTSSVDCDVEPGFCALLRHLFVDHGVRRLAYLGGPPGQLESDVREALFRREVVTFGAECRSEWVHHGDFGPHSGRAVASSLFETLAGPDGRLPFQALVCANDAMAAGAIEAFTARGVRVPEDLAVTGVDGTPEWDLVEIPITTVRQSPEAQAHLAAGALLEAIRTGQPVRSQRVASQLKLRRSCGCPVGTGAVSPAAIREAENHWSLIQSLRDLAETLQASSSMPELLDCLAASLSQIGMTDYRLFLLEDPRQSTGPLRLHLEGRRGSPPKTCPEGVVRSLWTPFPADGVEVVEALGAQDRLLGFLVLRCPVKDTRLSSPLRAHVSEALQSVLLLDELRHTQRGLIQAEKLLALGSLVGGLAHEINTPLGVALTSVSVMEDSAQRQQALVEAGGAAESHWLSFLETQREAAVVGHRSLVRVNRLIETFKQVSIDHRTEERKVFLPKESLELAVVGCKADLREGSELSFHVEGPEDLEMDSYPWSLVLVFSNLLANCVSHAFVHGQAGTIEAGFAAQGERLHFWLSDDGCGMSAEVQERMYDPFFSTKGTQGATGLGLHIVSNQVTGRLGGHLTCTSHPGQGTRFDLDLPRRAPQGGSR